MKPRSWKVILALLWVMTVWGLPTARVASPAMARAHADMIANGQAHAELSSYGLTMKCRPPQVMDIVWTTTVEENVAGYKVHRHSLDGEQGHEWINSVPLAARGPGDYRLLDSHVVPNRRYLYRLYVFDATYQLSQAQQIVLANPAQPTCLHLPIIRNTR